MFQRDDDCLEIEVLVAPDSTLFLIAAVIEPLRAANRMMGRELYRWRLTTPEGAPIQTTAGLEIPSAGRFEPTARRGPLFVIASYHPGFHAGRDLLRRLREAGRAGRIVCGVESGPWLMARAGLLEGRAATVHWEDLDEFAAAFPQIDTRPDRYVIDGARITAGGSAPTLDLMLRLVAARQGEAAAQGVSRLFIYEPAGFGLGAVGQRGGGAPARGQAAPGFERVSARDRRVAQALRVMEETVAEPLSIAQVAARAGVSARRLQSLFQRVLGVGPGAHYLGLRLDAARRMLSETGRPAFEIADRCGFTSPGAFARAYRARFGESPTALRRRAALGGERRGRVEDGRSLG